MLELIFNCLALLALSAGLSFTALALWAMRIGTATSPWRCSWPSPR